MSKRLYLVLLILVFAGCKKVSVHNAYINVIYTYGGPEAISDMSFPTSETGYLCGSNGLTLKSVDGGKTWNKLIPDSLNDNFIAIYFENANNGLVRASFDGYYFTTNGGNTWSQDTAAFYALYHKFKLIFPSGNTFYIDSLHGYEFLYDNIINFGYIGKTTDGGKSWQMIYTGQKNDVNYVSFCNAQTGFAVGTQTILTSTNSGTSWQPLYDQRGISPGTYTKVSAVSSGLAFALEGNSITKISTTQ
jgi:photosystem II stability/assembly factor-like uncharacterized protein